MFFNKRNNEEDEFYPYDYRVYNNTAMNGYKAFNRDMSCLDVTYQKNKHYVCFEDIHIRKCGFHFCKNIINCFDYYPISSETIICQVSAYGKIIQMQDVVDREESNSYSNPFVPQDIYVTNNIYIGEECSKEKILG